MTLQEERVVEITAGEVVAQTNPGVVRRAVNRAGSFIDHALPICGGVVAAHEMHPNTLTEVVAGIGGFAVTCAAFAIEERQKRDLFK